MKTINMSLCLLFLISRNGFRAVNAKMLFWNIFFLLGCSIFLRCHCSGVHIVFSHQSASYEDERCIQFNCCRSSFSVVKVRRFNFKLPNYFTLLQRLLKFCSGNVMLNTLRLDHQPLFLGRDADQT